MLKGIFRDVPGTTSSSVANFRRGTNVIVHARLMA